MTNPTPSVALLLLCAACSSVPLFDDLTRTANTGGELIPEDAALAVTLQRDVYAHVAVRHMPQLADVSGGLPIVIPPRARPIAGVPFTLAWSTRPSAPFPDAPTALLVSFTEPGDPNPIPNGRGGMLQVPTKYVFRPGDVSWLTQSDGVVRLDRTFAAKHVGVRVWCQLVVKHPVAGVLTSPVAALTVGNR